MRARHRGKKTYYFLDTGAKSRKEISLGQNYAEAIAKWADITKEPPEPGKKMCFKDAAEEYMREVLVTKAPETQKLNHRELRNLYRFFDDPPMLLDDVDPIDVRSYMTWRAKDARTQAIAANDKRAREGRPTLPVSSKIGQVPANREKALLSHIWNFAREKGFTNKANPCSGIKGYSESGRDAYIEDEAYSAVWDCAEDHLRNALDLAYLTGQRPADVLKMSRADVRDGAMSVTQKKTGAKLRVEIVGELAVVMERITGGKVAGLALICDRGGQQLTKFGLRGAFDRARDLAAEASQIAAGCAGLPDITSQIRSFQFRDLRAKAGTDTEELRGMAAAKDQLGHTSEGMTAHYVRHRRGKLVKPTK
jgi:integrase